MGSGGKQHKVKPASKISGINRDDFDVNEAELYKLWQIYYRDRILSNKSPVDAAGKVLTTGVSFNEMKYLLALGLELVTSEYFREGSRVNGKPLGMSH
jgi:hypothetical protein